MKRSIYMYFETFQGPIGAPGQTGEPGKDGADVSCDDMYLYLLVL